MRIPVNGHEAYAYTGGKSFDAALPCAVFVHGAQHDHSVWILQTRYFAHHGFGVLAVDLPGHNRSQGPALATIEQMADWVAALLDAAGVAQSAMIVGHSMGSLIALECAARHPQRVDRIALVATAYPMKVSDTLLDAARNDEAAAIAMTNAWSHSGIANKPSHPGPGFWMHGGNRRLMERVSSNSPGAQVFHRDFSACNAYTHGLEAAAALHCPALFLLGERDMMTPPRAAGALAKAMRDARTVVLPASHAVMAEQPDATLDTLYGFACQSVTA